MQKLDPKAVWLFSLGKDMIGLPFIFIIGGYLSKLLESFTPILWTLASIPVLVIFNLILAKLHYHFIGYELREDGFRKESGIIRKKYVMIPYDRIQNVDIYRGILDRILGLSTLSIQTAGASGYIGSEGSLPGLSHKIAEQIRDELIRRSRQSRTIHQGL